MSEDIHAAGPRYREIEWWLRERTRNSLPGSLLPSESELAVQFHVSRMTARQAVQNLAKEGLVIRRRGSGTYVAEHPLHRNGGVLFSFTEDMRRRGLAARSELLEASLRPAVGAEADSLRLADGQRVVSIERIRFADDIPLAIERAVLLTSCAGVLSADLETGSLHEALAALGHVPTIAQSWITARMPTGEEMKLLHLTSEREPLLVELRIIRDQNDVPVEHTESAYIASRYVIDATFQMSEPRPGSARPAKAHRAPSLR